MCTIWSFLEQLGFMIQISRGRKRWYYSPSPLVTQTPSGSKPCASQSCNLLLCWPRVLGSKSRDASTKRKTIPRGCKLDFFLSQLLMSLSNTQEQNHDNSQELHHHGETGLEPHNEGNGSVRKLSKGISVSQCFMIKASGELQPRLRRITKWRLQVPYFTHTHTL